MTDALTHRGPDGYGYFRFNKSTGKIRLDSEFNDETFHVQLGHRRLSIIDLDTSKQPLSNEDNTIWVTFNGEIYNYKELRSLLINKGHQFKTHGDTEVLVHLWEEYGSGLLDKLVGMFSFAIYDSRKDELFCARDRLGQKPFYYYYQENHFFTFASELQGLYHFPSFPLNDLNFQSLAQYFQYGYIPSPNTIFKSVHSLPAAHYIHITQHKINIHCYWQPDFQPKSNLQLDKVEDLINESVKSQLISDVPLGVFLSGGLDSSILTGLASKFTNTGLNTFNISMDNTSLDESAHAQQIAEHLNTNHRVINVEPEFSKLSEKLAIHYGQPFADYSQIPSYLVCQASKPFIKVALSGDGGDEVFGGYDRYKNYNLNYMLSLLTPSYVKRYLIKPLQNNLPLLFRNSQAYDFILSSRLLPGKGEQHSNLFIPHIYDDLFSSDYHEHMASHHSSLLNRFTQLYFNTTARTPVEKWMEVDQQMYLPDNILVKMDIASMANSIECRAPFLDHRLIEHVNALHLNDKIRRNRTKIILRSLASRHLPRQIASLPKKGFSIPLDSWMRHELKDWMEQYLFLKNTPLTPLINPNNLNLMWQDHQSGRRSHTLRLWTFIQFNLWYQAKENFQKNNLSRENLNLSSFKPLDKKPTILMAIDSLEHGGAENQFLGISANLPQDFNIQILLMARKGTLYNKINLAKVGPVYCFNKVSSSDNFAILFYLRSLLSFVNPKIVNPWLFYSIFTMCLTSAKSNFIISHLRSSLDAFNIEERRTIFRILKNLLLDFSLKRTQIITTNSATNFKKLSHTLPDKKIVHIPNFIRVTPLPSKPPKIINYSKPTIIFVGRMVREKGIFVLIAALKLLNEQNQSFKAIYFGSGPDSPILEKTIHEMKLNHLVTIKSYQNDMATVYENADILILPSYSEGSPNVLLEAMAFSLPVIASNVAGINDIVSHMHNGYLFNPGSENNLAIQITSLLKNTAATESIRTNAFNFSKEFSLERSIQLHTQLYSSALSDLSI